MRACMVRITKASFPSYWYAGNIGEVFEVWRGNKFPEYGFLTKRYLLTEDRLADTEKWRTIKIGDCEEVEEET